MRKMEQALALVRLTRREALAAAVVVSAGFAVARTVASPKTITFPARRNGNIQQVFWVPDESAMIICDMWNDHWCKHAAARTAKLAPKVDAFASRLRPYGVLIVHSPSDTMDFYTGTPQRNRAKDAPKASTPKDIRTRGVDRDIEPPLPIDYSDGGCDDSPPSHPKEPYPWTREHDAIRIADEDVVSDQGEEIYNVFASRKIRNVFILGVHTNECVLERPFGIREMVRLIENVVLVRDLTDSIYNPAKPPYVNHDEGTRLVIEHIERYWCPSVAEAEVVI